MTQYHLDLIEQQGYVMVIDEEVSMIEPLEAMSSGDTGYTNNDLKYLYNDGKLCVDKEDFGRLVWNWDEYGDKAKYSRLKSMCDLGMVYCADSKIDHSTGNKIDEIHSLVTQLPLRLLQCCQRVVLITYMFSGSIMDSFLRMKGVDVVDIDKEAEGISLRYSDEQAKEQIRDLINIVETYSTRKVANRRLTYTYYANEFSEKESQLISTAIRSVGRECQASAKDVMWTCPRDRAFGSKQNRNYVKPRGYGAKQCFVPCSARATNDYCHKNTLIHALYRHPNLTVERYLSHYGVGVDKNNFALSEIIQWVWRSRIRDQQPINLSILSSRMRILFLEWLGKL
jgi:hypothetical protein